jgi:amino acid transporter, AAT family
MQDDKHLQRGLSAGPMAMLAVGGSIGTGLFLASGAAIGVAGPAIGLSYVVAALVTYVVTMALGEMAAKHPEAGSFGVAAEIYLGPWAGFVSRYGYWIAILLSVGAEMVAAATYMHFWFPNVPGTVWMLLFGSFVVGVNLFPVRGLGRFEFGFAMIKVITILFFVTVGAWLLLSHRVAPMYLSSGSLWPRGLRGPLLAVPFALFSFLGVEMLAASAGEAESAVTIKRSSWMTIVLLSIAYLGAIVVLAGVVPWDQTNTAQSPFVTVFELARVHAASDIMNFVVLSAALSGSVATLYVCSRTIYSLAQSGMAPESLKRLSRHGVPVASVLLSTGGAVGAIVLQRLLPQTAYLYIIGASLFGGMLMWVLSLAAHIKMLDGMSAQERSDAIIRVPGGRWTSGAALVVTIIAVIATWWIPGFSITVISGPFYLALLTVMYWIWRRTLSNEAS